MQCIDLAQNGILTTPIFSYFKRNGSKIDLDANKLTFKEEDIKMYFGISMDQYEFVYNIEYFEFINLFFGGNLQKKAQAFFKEKVKQGEIHKHWEESQKAICDQKKVKFLKTGIAVLAPVSYLPKLFGSS